MKVYSDVQPQPVQLVDLGKVTRARLAKNVQPHTTEESTGYQYDEVVFEITSKPNLQSQIEQDFEIYFAYGLQYMEQQNLNAIKQAELARLIQKSELPIDLTQTKADLEYIAIMTGVEL